VFFFFFFLKKNTTCKGPGATIFHSKDIASYNEDKSVTPMVY